MSAPALSPVEVDAVLREQTARPATVVDVFSPEVLAYAEQNEIKTYLQPLMDATRRIFSKAQIIKVYVKEDPEVPGDSAIVYDVRTPGLQYPESWAARKAWTTELCRICPAPLTCYLTLLLDLSGK